MPVPRRFVAFDLETTSPDPEQARVVTAFIGLFDVVADDFVEKHHWLLDPGVAIPEEAAAIHGYTTEDVQLAGMDPRIGVFAITQRLDIYQRENLAITAYNGRYDFTVLDRELRRHYPGITPFAPKALLDPYLLDKMVDPYRKGSRKLTAVAEHYRVPVEENAHDAEADSLMTARVAVRVLQHPALRQLTPMQVHARCVPEAVKQARSFAAYLTKQGRHSEARLVRAEWPIPPLPVA